MAEQKNDNMQKVAVKQALKELPDSPFIEHDIADIIRQKVEYQAYVGDDGYSVYHDVDYRKITEQIIETLEKHMI